MSTDVKIISHIPETINATNAAISRALEAVGIQAESIAKSIITAEERIDTDRMRGSVAHQVVESEKAVYIGSPLKYALYNEVGTGIYTEGGGGRKSPWFYVDAKGDGHWTVGLKPIHMFKRTATENADEFKKIFEKYLQDG